MQSFAPLAVVPANTAREALNVAMLLSCGSFEGFFGGVQRARPDRAISQAIETTGRGTMLAVCWKTV